MQMYLQPNEESGQKEGETRTSEQGSRATILYFEEEQTELEKTFPRITEISEGYDLALVDLPISLPKYHTSHIPYETLPVQYFRCLESVFRTVMNRNSVLLIWSSPKLLPSILELIGLWGFQYVNFLLVWVKLTQEGVDQMGLGYWTRNNAEFLILATRGKCAQWRNDNRDVK